MKKTLLSEIFGQNIQRKRKQLGLTQDELAEKLSIGQQSLSRIERGVMAPKFERLQDIADILRCSVFELFMDGERRSEEAEIVLREVLMDLKEREREVILRFVADAVRVFKKEL